MKKKFFLKNLALLLTILLIPIFILGTFSILVTQRFIKENIENSNMNILTQSMENLDMIVKEVNSLSLNFGSDPVMSKRLKGILSSNEYSLEEMDSLNFIKNAVDIPANTKSYIHSIYVYFNNENNRFLSSRDGLTDLRNSSDKAWFESYSKMKDSEELWSETRDIKLYDFDKKTTPLVSIYKHIYTPGSIKSTGVIVLNIYASYVENILKSLATVENQSILVANASNDILFMNHKYSYLEKVNIQQLTEKSDRFFTLRIDNEVYTVSVLRSGTYGWSYISIVPQKSLYRLPYALRTATFLLLALSMVLGLILAYTFTRRNYSQIERIITVLQSAENGSTLPSLPSRVKDEYGFIIQNILKTFIEQSYLRVQLSERKYKMQALELMALQSQINPHFLNNTLHTIYWEVLNLYGKPGVATKMISNLTDILEYSLSNPNETVSLQEEIKNTQSYIEIQKVRYRDKFDFFWEYDEDVIQCQVIKLLLQPLIENSLYHGIKVKEGKGSIKVKMRRCQSYLRISVIDSGIGIPPDELKKLRHGLQVEGDYSEHIGLFNTNKRLILRYGEGYGVTIRSKYGLGTSVQFVIPL